MPRERSSLVFRVLKTALVLALLLFLGQYIVERWDDVSGESFTFSLPPFLAALVMLLSFYLLYGFTWVGLLRAVAPDMDATTTSLLKVFFLSFLLRYLPAGKVINVGTRIEAAHRAGAGRVQAAASLYHEQVLLMGGSVVLFLLAISIHPPVWIHPLFGELRFVAMLALFASLALLLFAPSRLLGLARWVFRLKADRAPGLAFPLLLLTFFRLLLVNLAQGGCAWFMLLAVHPGLADRGDLLPLVVAGYPVSRVLGQLAMVVPGGIGIREGTYVFLLSPTLAVRPVLISAALIRLSAVVMELCLLGILTVLSRRERSRADTSRSPGSPSP